MHGQGGEAFTFGLRADAWLDDWDSRSAIAATKAGAYLSTGARSDRGAYHPLKTECWVSLSVLEGWESRIMAQILLLFEGHLLWDASSVHISNCLLDQQTINSFKSSKVASKGMGVSIAPPSFPSGWRRSSHQAVPRYSEGCGLWLKFTGQSSFYKPSQAWPRRFRKCDPV